VVPPSIDPVVDFEDIISVSTAEDVTDIKYEPDFEDSSDNERYII